MKKPLVILLISALVSAGFGLVVKSLGNVNLELAAINSRLDTLGEPSDILVGASGFFAQNASVQGNLAFFGEIKPDGLACSNGQILKRIGTDNWDCSNDGVASNSLNFDEFQNPLVADTNITFTGGAFSFTFDHASVSSNFEVGGYASMSTGFVGNYLDFQAIANPSAPAAGIARLHALTNNGFTRFEQDNEAATNLTLGRDNVFIAKNTSGADIAKGKAVYITGSTGNVPNIALAQANSETTLPAVGMTLDAISNNAFGQITKLGIISNIDTSAFTAGDRIYVASASAGALTNVRPKYNGTNRVQRVGSVLVSGVGNGSLQISIAPFIGMEETGTNSTTYTFAGSASTALNFEAIGYASASLYQGTAFGGIDCNDAAEGLQWSGGIFTCRGWADADIPDAITVTGGTIGSNNISGTLTTTDTLTIGDNGDAVNFNTSTWDVTAGAFTGITTLTMTGHFSGATASLSGNFQTSARIIGGDASHSFGGTIEGDIDGGLDIGTTAKKIGQIVSNIVKAVTNFFLPTNVTPTVEGELAYHTASDTFDVYDGSVVRAVRTDDCRTITVEDPTNANQQWIDYWAFTDPVTLTSVHLVNASGSNSAGWNLYYGRPNTITSGTAVFGTQRNASSSAQIINYTSFSNSTISDGDIFDVYIASPSATLAKFTVKTCWRYRH